MRISKSTLIILILMLVFSILVANVANLLNTQVIYDSKKSDDSDLAQHSLRIEDGDEYLIWFVQVS